jgi:hypothetical protein
MLKNLLLAPGWFLYRRLTQKKRKFRYLAKPRDLGPIFKLAAVFWLACGLLCWTAFSLFSGASAPPPATAASAAVPGAMLLPEPADAVAAQVTGTPQPPAPQAAVPQPAAPAPSAPDGPQPLQQSVMASQGLPGRGPVQTPQPAASAAQPAAAAPAAGQVSPAAPAAGAADPPVHTPLIVPEELRLNPGAAPQAPQAWLVIIESIPKSARDKAEASLSRQKKKGLNLVLIDTDAYPRLKSGMWALSMGPFDTKADAEAAAAGLEKKVKDFMVRRGL